MNRTTSTYLDLIRVIAASTVFLSHLAVFAFTNGVKPAHAYNAHVAVVAFFVISGYVIAFVADQRDTTLRRYAVNRAARIYSVAIPTLIITTLIDVYIAMSAQTPLSYQYAALWKYLPLFLAFGHEFWFLQTYAFSDPPYWSLSYEVWYYVAFAILIYLKGAKRALSLTGVALLVGPRIVLLAPIWFLGVQLYRCHSAKADLFHARAIFFGSVTALIVVRAIGLDLAISEWSSSMIGDWFHWRFRFSDSFLGDYSHGECACQG
jgi:peptidoglycan/LPS O-acetylase OafA/YrhL